MGQKGVFMDMDRTADLLIEGRSGLIVLSYFVYLIVALCIWLGR